MPYEHLSQQLAETVGAHGLDTLPFVELVEEVGPSDVGQHREDARLKSNPRGVEQLHGQQHRFSGANETLVFHRAEPGDMVEQELLLPKRLNLPLIGRGDAAVRLYRRDAARVTGSGAPDVNQGQRVLTTPIVVQQRLIMAFSVAVRADLDNEFAMDGC